jgi:hypothetical protein
MSELEKIKLLCPQIIDLSMPEIFKMQIYNFKSPWKRLQYTMEDMANTKNYSRS